MSTIISRLGKYGLGFAALLTFSSAIAQGGTLDLSFNPGTGTNGNVWASARQADGKILIGGSFTTYQGYSANRIARLNANGSFDATFNTYGGFNGPVYSIVVQPDGNILVGGDFTAIAGKPYQYIVRLRDSGIFESSFTVSYHYLLNAGVRAMALQPDGKIVVGGVFTMHGTYPRSRITRFNANGTPDLSFNPGLGANDFIAAVALTSTGQIYVGGDFTLFNNTARGRIARLNNNGSLDPAFNSTIGASGGGVRTIALYPTNSVAVGGQFTQYNGAAANRLARVLPTGALDPTFTSPNTATINSTIYTLQVMLNLKLIVGGLFNSGTPRGVLRLMTNGSLDGTFNPFAGLNTGPSYVVTTSFLDPSDRIFIGGLFNSYNGTTMNNLARLQGLPSLVQGNDEDGTLQNDGVRFCSAQDSAANRGANGQYSRLSGSMSIYPNPNNGTRLKVDLSAISWSDNPIEIRILDLQDRLVLNPWLMPADGTLQTELNLEDPKNGVYLLSAQNAKGVLATSRLVIQH